MMNVLEALGVFAVHNCLTILFANDGAVSFRIACCSYKLIAGLQIIVATKFYGVGFYCFITSKIILALIISSAGPRC